ncbi:hypothetical protein [Cytophaga hutchinsonii]|uniref:Uncharacterized protein n=1 Tax=Cytophaga hutchinsonii (strain ATCC 33406 / DSM 1761 / CIP 103989 / NBRC 15051 / NCIMB 9469 / D465) TaxID=269798 RepID=A0A6N4SNG3_CYTH3|nr:hypothetical protein [Cytophaga hutchinsonii]ABG57791.1 hypothetical protein CHU_0502 [Cytophaga hutchinsonii ATCC 33406]SFX05700.1 hypothetical protein SAMN04487930_101343 [Cytophaga hutchinsonii ATCC 33406]
MEIAKEHEDLLFNWYEDSVYTLFNTDLNTFRKHELYLATCLYEVLEAKKNTCKRIFL